jgi:hypothetical protein
MLGRGAVDPAAFAAVPRLYAEMQPAPKLDRSAIPFTPGCYQNNILPNCVAVALANSARATAWVHTGADILVNDAKVPAAYAAWVGCDDTMEAMAASDGVNMIHAYNYAEGNGFDLGEQVPLVPVWRRIEPKDRMALAHAMLYGGVPLGVNLSRSDDKTTGSTWTLNPPAPAGDPKPGSWGGHAIMAWDYTGLGDDDIVRLATWGTWQSATWGWLENRMDEAYAVSWRQLAVA